MAYSLRANGIITGTINSFCLACESFFKTDQEATDHIIQSNHKKNLNAVPYMEKFKSDNIRKFKAGYFCEFCNILLPIAAKVNFHILEGEHKHNKGLVHLRPEGGDIIAFNNVLIEEKSWHGLMEGICSVCSTEIDNENEHKNDTKHSLNVILKPVKFGVNNAIYRQIDASAVQCLTCNKLLATNKSHKHFNGTEHLDIFEKHRIITNGICQVETKDVKNENEILDTSTNDCKTNTLTSNEQTDIHTILQSINKYQSKGININLETETAFCKKCVMKVKLEFAALEKHIENHSKITKVESDFLYPSNVDHNLNRVNINDRLLSTTEELKESGMNKTKLLPITETENRIDATGIDDSDNCTNSCENSKNNSSESSSQEILDFAKQNNITYNKGMSKAFCRTCNVQVPSSLKCLNEHVIGASHKKMAAASNQTVKTEHASRTIMKQSTLEYVDSVVNVQRRRTYEHSYYDSVINEKFCIPRLSFWLISENKHSTARCLVCNMNLPRYVNIKNHIESAYHKTNFLSIQVVTSVPHEFIREVREGIYHCGYCNVVASSWGQLQQHLACYEHRCQRGTGTTLLKDYLPQIQIQISMKRLEICSLFRMFDLLN